MNNLKIILRCCTVGIFFIFLACGMNVKTEPVKVEPIKVEHTITLDTEKLTYYYKLSCEKEFQDIVDPVEKEKLVNGCVATKVTDFLDAFNYLK